MDVAISTNTCDNHYSLSETDKAAQIRALMLAIEEIEDFISYEIGHYHVYANESAIKLQSNRANHLRNELAQLTADDPTFKLDPYFDY